MGVSAIGSADAATVTVIERLEGGFGETLQPVVPERPAGHRVIEIGRSAPPTGGTKKT
jgi:hypothetical protein